MENNHNAPSEVLAARSTVPLACTVKVATEMLAKLHLSIEIKSLTN